MSPDLICVLDSVTGEAIGTETIRYGQRVTVIALPPPSVTGLYLIDSAFAGDWDTFRDALAHLVLPAVSLVICIRPIAVPGDGARRFGSPSLSVRTMHRMLFVSN